VYRLPYNTRIIIKLLALFGARDSDKEVMEINNNNNNNNNLYY